MKLSSYQLESHLGNKLMPVYLVSGDEILLKQDAIHMIRKSAKASGYQERIRISPEAGYDWEDLYQTLYSNSLFTEKRLIEFDFRDNLPPKTGSQLLQQYADKPSPDNLILIDLCKVDDKIAKSAWFKALEKIGVSIPLWPIPREQIPQWIMNRAKRYKLQLQLEAANTLSDYFEGNLIAAAQTIEKIYLLKPEGTIDISAINAILTDESRFTVFDLVDNLIAGHRERSLHILETLKNEGVEPILTLWSIARELRILANLAGCMSRGASFADLCQQHRIFSKRQPSIRLFLSKHNEQHCWEHLSHCSEIDRQIKGGTPGSVWNSLQLLSLRITK